MSNRAKFYLLLAGGAAFFTVLALDLHRVAIAAVWPYLTAYFDYLAA